VISQVDSTLYFSKELFKRVMRVVDIFSGGGGLTLGFKNAGYDIIAAFDNWKPAVDLYRMNFKEHPIFEWDLKHPDTVDKINRFTPDIIIGGPPCQDFSSAGKRDETLGRADLTIVFSQIVSKVAPRYFLMENVDRAYKSQVYAVSKEILLKAGYALTDIILDASYCGVPQKRKRLFLFGELNGEESGLKNILIKNQSKKPITLRDYFGRRLGVEHYYRHPRSYKRRGVFSIDEPSPTIRGVNRPVPKGYPGHKGDTTDISKNIRSLTTRERSMIQTFPENFILEGSKTEVEQVLGNAVPVKLAQYVAECINEYLNIPTQIENSLIHSFEKFRNSPASSKLTAI
jgi:DNA (cytosine-5)-methyltransferase 1